VLSASVPTEAYKSEHPPEGPAKPGPFLSVIPSGRGFSGRSWSHFPTVISGLTEQAITLGLTVAESVTLTIVHWYLAKWFQLGSELQARWTQTRSGMDTILFAQVSVRINRLPTRLPTSRAAIKLESVISVISLRSEVATKRVKS